MSQTSILSLRNLGLNLPDVSIIAAILKVEKNRNSNSIISISFSYNPLIGDLGAKAIVKNLPKSVIEIGLVDCGIDDLGGYHILTWMKKSPALEMICIEQNNFSETLKMEFQNFKRNNPNVIVVF